MPEETEHKEIGQRVKRAIRQSGHTQVYVAKQLGMTPPVLSRLLKEGRNLKLPQLQRIAAICDVPLADLIGTPPQEAAAAWQMFKELILLEVPAFVAYDLATGRGGNLSPEERQRLNAAGDRLRAAYQAGQGPANIVDLFAREETTEEPLPPKD